MFQSEMTSPYFFCLSLASAVVPSEASSTSSKPSCLRRLRMMRTIVWYSSTTRIGIERSRAIPYLTLAPPAASGSRRTGACPASSRRTLGQSRCEAVNPIARRPDRTPSQALTREGVLDSVAARLDAAISDMPSAPAPEETAGAFAVGRDGDAVPAALRGAILAIGNFDGVHRGHRALIEIAIREGRARRAPAAVLTFEPHPRKFFAPDKPLFRLTPEPAKLAVFRKLGLDGAFVRRFDAGLAGTSAAAFVERLLGQELGASGVVVGHDFHFGKGRQGTPALLEALCREKGWACVIVPPVTSGGAS